MARSLSQLQEILSEIPNVKEVYIQAPTDRPLQDPCIMIERGGLSDVKFADNTKYRLLRAYDVTIIDRAPDSNIPDQVEGLPYAEFNRFFRSDGLNHFVFQLYF